MVGITTLWLPILLSAVVVFVASSIIHMMLPYHRSDWTKIPGEDGLREAFLKTGAGPGNYFIPHMTGPSEMKKPEVQAKYKQGPVGMISLMKPGAPAMGTNLVMWFIYSLFVGLFVAYVTGRTHATGSDYLSVFRIAGTVAFLAYAGAEPLNSIWRAQKWSTSVKHVVDGLVYALLTAGMFGWLWPR